MIVCVSRVVRNFHWDNPAKLNKWDGTASQPTLVKEFTDGGQGSFVLVCGKFFIKMYNTVHSLYELYESDGTDAGTALSALDPGVADTATAVALLKEVA